MSYEKCKVCVTDKTECIFCPDNPEYVHIKRHSLFQAYVPACPLGYRDCISDPAYIKCYHSEWYKELYGDKIPYEAAEKCRKRIEEDPDGFCYNYDDEDK